MKKFTLQSLVAFLCLFGTASATAQQVQKSAADRPLHRCVTMEKMEEAIRNNPGLLEQWKLEGERQYHSYLQRQAQGGMVNARMQAGEIVIPVVFHLVDNATRQAGITDRDFYEQVEILNSDYSGKKMDQYLNVIPQQIAARVGRMNIRFTLARRDPAGNLTSGIERRTATTPSRINIKSTANGGLDAWDVTKYLNIWVGTFSGADAGLLGIATFPFTTSEGPQGVVIGTGTLPYTSATSRGYYPQYSEGATLSHEVGHYLYLWHTFGDQSSCNNADFRIQSGWPLGANGAGGSVDDDTPEEKASGSIYFGNPSMNYSDGCTPLSFGMMYGSYMNYFDDRALFMFSAGHKKRVDSCIYMYRPGLLTTNGATPPVAVTDAFLVNVTSRGLPERRAYVLDNTPIQAIVRNNGTATLTSVTLNYRLDANAVNTITVPLNLAAGRDTTLSLGTITGTDGNHTLTIYVAAPNNGTDNFLHNDTLQSFVNINAATAITAPLTEDFASATFPPANWRLWNPQGNTTWVRSSTAGYNAAGSATVDNYNYNGAGQLDDLISPAIDFGTRDSSLLTFKVAHQTYDPTDVSAWDGLEVYVSNNGGKDYVLVYKKSGSQLTSAGTNFNAFTPTSQAQWRNETINLSPYIVSGQKMIVKFRNVTGYGNNTYLDDINITAVTKQIITLDLAALNLQNAPAFTCSNSLTPSLVVKNNATNTVNSYKVNYRLDGGAVVTIPVNNPLTAGQTATVSLGTINNLSTTNHSLLVYVSEPNGTNDAVPANDTLRQSFMVFPTVVAPLRESFEGTFPPTGWAVNNPDNNITWQKTTLGVLRVNASDSASAYVRNFAYPGTNNRDEMYSPIINYSNADSVFLKFDVAAVTTDDYITLSKDTLEVLITTNCGASFQTVYKMSGSDLQTFTSPRWPMSEEFKPTYQTSFWRRDSVNLLPFLGNSSSFQLVFRSIHSYPGNNIFLDNINMFTRSVPQTLKQQGYLILPTAFNNQFAVWHYNQPVNLKAINIFNSVGQLIWRKQFSSNADKYIPIDMSSKASGVYVIGLEYTDGSNITQRVIKY